MGYTQICLKPHLRLVFYSLLSVYYWSQFEISLGLHMYHTFMMQENIYTILVLFLVRRLNPYHGSTGMVALPDIS